MAAKVTWKGSLSLGLINVPVGAVAVAESAEKISFNQLHGPCKARISQKKVCTSCGEEVSNGEIVKGYEFTKGNYVVVPDDKLDALKVESDRQIKLTAFVDDDLDPLLIEKSYYLVPGAEGKANGPYVVLQNALGIKTGIGTVSMYGREYQCAVQARGNGFVMHTLYTAKEIRDISRLDQFGELAGIIANPQEIKLATMLIDRMEDEVDLSEFVDRRKEGIRNLIQAIIEGKEPETIPVIEPQASTGSLLASLEAMLSAVEPKKGMAKAKMAEKTLAGEKAVPLAKAATKTVRQKKSA